MESPSRTIPISYNLFPLRRLLKLLTSKRRLRQLLSTKAFPRCSRGSQVRRPSCSPTSRTFGSARVTRPTPLSMTPRPPTDRPERGVAGVKAGSVVCVTAKECGRFESLAERTVDLEGGAIQPGLVTYGSPRSSAKQLSSGQWMVCSTKPVTLRRFIRGNCPRHPILTTFGQAGLPCWGHFGHRCTRQ